MSDILLNNFKNYISQQKLFTTGDLLLLAVSGGIDSVALCELCHLAGYRFIIAHCNFQLRADESDKDEALVKMLGEKYATTVLVKKFDTEGYAASQKCSIQVAARELRYKWFKEIIEEKTEDTNNLERPTYLLTAHHADDNVETVLMNLFKGTGISGLRGILPKAGKIVRPLLFAQKQELAAFIKQRALSYREDSSNASDKYSRNYIRHNIIPAIETIYPQVSLNINKTSNHFKEVEILFNQAIDSHKKKLLGYKNNEVHIPVLKLKQAVPLKTILFEIVKDYGFSPAQVDEVLKLLDSESGKYMLSPTHRILKNRNWLVISPLHSTKENIIVIDEETDMTFYENGKLSLTKRMFNQNKTVLTSDPNIAMLDMKDIHFPLLLRKWKEGDYFYPLGMQKKKKLARFLIDKKISIVEKEKIWVLEMNKKIIWIVGQRIDDRFKLTSSTKKILQITLETT